MIQPTKTTRLYHFGLENFKQKLKKDLGKFSLKINEQQTNNGKSAKGDEKNGKTESII